MPFSRKPISAEVRAGLPSKSNSAVRKKCRKMCYRLEQLESPEATQSVPWKDVRVPCKVVDVYDGDTCTVVMMLDGVVPFKYKIRFLGIDSPEKRTKNLLEKEAGLLVADYVSNLIDGKIIYIEVDDQEVYGRMLGYLYMQYEDEVSINDKLIELGLVRPYDGKTKRGKWRAKDLSVIVDKCNELLGNSVSDADSEV